MNKDLTWQSIAEIYQSQEFADYLKSQYDLNEKLESAKSYYQKLQVIREFYVTNIDQILECHNKNPHLWFGCYPTDWYRLFTPIEANAWQTIRGKGLVFYPQFPILNYHADFANPGFRISVEIDGKDFHDKERDLKRDREIRKAYWQVLRIPGSEMVNQNFNDWSEIRDMGLEEPYEVLPHLEHWIMNTGDGVFEALRVLYFNSVSYADNWDDPEDYIHNKFLDYCHETIKSHQLYML